jgi:ElaB/YqjD/DUF883 family membrane-anchored ribosome-binding protein
MGKKFTWYNNGIGNIKIFEGETPNDNMKKGYIVVRNKQERLRDLNKRYEKMLNKYLEKMKQKVENYKQNWDNNLKKEQKKIYNDL